MGILHARPLPILTWKNPDKDRRLFVGQGGLTSTIPGFLSANPRKLVIVSRSISILLKPILPDRPPFESRIISRKSRHSFPYKT